MTRYCILLTFIIALLGCSSSTSTGPVDKTAPDIEVPMLTECEDGSADGFSCSNVDLYANLTPSELGAESTDNVSAAVNDIWGWIDPQTGREYALVGLTDGISIVDVTNPVMPVVVAKALEIPSQNKSERPLMQNHEDGDGFKGASSWRDMKVYQNYMYVVTEQNHGMQVFDLARLRDIENPPAQLREDFHYTRFGNAHNIAINEETGFAYVVGSTRGEDCAEQGGLHMINLHDNPLQPTFAGCYFDEEAGGVTRDGYIHDTQCVIYEGVDSQFSGEEICFSSAEKTFLITNVSDKEEPVTISNSTYPGANYVHQGWLTENHEFFFINDEGDELATGNNTRTYIWRLGELEAPEFLGFYEHSTKAIDHNLYIKNDLMYQANYTAGLRILDISNPLPGAVNEVGFFNTTPINSEPVFAGAWSVYPWLTDNKIIVSDISKGLFILRYNP